MASAAVAASSSSFLLILHLASVIVVLISSEIPSVTALNVQIEYIYPNYTVSNFYGVDNSGAFLVSLSKKFKVAIYNPGQQQSSFYLCIIHVPTATIIWSANRNAPISSSGLVQLTAAGIFVTDSGGKVEWSTPPLAGAVAAMQLGDDGNVLLLDAKNASLWESFEHPTDTIVSGQNLAVGSVGLTSSVSDDDLAEGAYSLIVTTADAVLRWSGDSRVYWSLSTDPRSVKETNAAVSFLALNNSGIYLLSGGSQSQIVFQFLLSGAASSNLITFANLDTNGRLHVTSYSGSVSTSSPIDQFVAPENDCDLPMICGPLQLCSLGTNGSSCSCPAPFAVTPSGECTPADGSTLNCSTATNSTIPNYLSLGAGIGYFANKFASAAESNVDLDACQQICSANCSCAGFFFENSTGSCFIVDQQLGSLSKATDVASIGYIKTFATNSNRPNSSKPSSSNILAIVLPSVAALLLIVILLVIASQWWKRRRGDPSRSNWKLSSSSRDIKLGRQKPRLLIAANEEERDDDDDHYDILIPGLPTRFGYDELVVATDDFSTRIGAGGFGEVFKGVIDDKVTVAVKKISNLGLQGKKEFFTEIAVIGSIHHVNLVRLRGFCAQGSRRLLVYEYMNRGSLDRSLFYSKAVTVEPPLEWPERLEIAIGAARGLAYLHSGCDHKIIHCDVKPENILLQYGGSAKISDFGMVKLLNREQSALFTTMRGTRGYLAPEWLTSSAITDRTDVYSFGMVLLELVSGRKNGSFSGVVGADGDEPESHREYFPLMALEMHEAGKYKGLVDAKLKGRATESEVGRVVRVALCCLHEDPSLRPSMEVVVGMLEGTVPEWIPCADSLNFLRLYGRGNVAKYGGGVPYIAGGIFTQSLSSATTDSPSYVLSAQDVSGPR